MLSYPCSRVDEYCCLGPPGRRGHTGGHRVSAKNRSSTPINAFSKFYWTITVIYILAVKAFMVFVKVMGNHGNPTFFVINMPCAINQHIWMVTYVAFGW